MKIYKKKDQNLSKRPSEETIAKMGSTLGSIDELARRFQKFYRKAHVLFFEWMVNEVWLEQKFTYGGVRRNGRSGNGYTADSVFAFFMRAVVGISQKPFTAGFFFIAIPTYFKDFFPNFSDHDPDDEPEYFKYPYKHVTLDHLAFVYQVHNRLELLDWAEEHAMTIHDFENWATQQCFAYNDEENISYTYYYRDGREEEMPRYKMWRWSSFVPYIRDMKN